MAFLALASGVAAGVTSIFDRNLAYASPFLNQPQLSHDTATLQARHLELVKRQWFSDTESSKNFKDEHYPTFYGGDFSNSPYIYSGGVNFTHSVASGDPFHDSVLLWTRAVPLGLPDQSVPVCISFKIFDNPQLQGRPLDTGDAFTSYDVDFTLKVEAKNLQPDTSYWYQFADCTNPETASPVGMTRTISSPDTPAHLVNKGKPLTLAVFSCARYQDGYFNAYGVATHNTSADIFVHLGDYIYESLGDGAPIGRATLGRELATLEDYRGRLSQYRTDWLLRFDASPRFVTNLWYLPRSRDDHEVADQAWKAGTADSNDTTVGCSFSPSGACFTDRKLAAVRAYHEWMPIRQVDPDDKLRVWRNFQIGKLLDLTMLDTRQYDRDITDLYYNTVGYCSLLSMVLRAGSPAAVIDSIADQKDRSLMGADQETWFYNALSASQERGAIWRVVGQQIVFTQIDLITGFDVDAWDGYRANRNRFLDHLYDNAISNTIILSGDSHANWASDLARPNDTITYDPLTGEGAIGVEFAGTAVSSTSTFGAGILPDAADKISRNYVRDNVDLQWSEGSYRGFFTLTLNTSTAVATYYAMRNVSYANLDAFASATFVVHTGTNKLSRPVAGGSVGAGVLKTQAL
ncbi:PhoD-like phosphatase-domain-containing protein [Cubamyces menziesii]|nr:PhoD-like phosphatase-domain-containing protein [Cubamyces menziesii]